jgi:putative DNA primase/helicase
MPKKAIIRHQNFLRPMLSLFPTVHKKKKIKLKRRRKMKTKRSDTPTQSTKANPKQPSLFEPEKVQILTMEDQPIIRSAADITPRAIRWLWPGYLASGKLHILCGVAGTGKSTLAYFFASIISTGGQWPTGENAQQGHVLIWSGEDDVEDTIVPRLIACDAQRERIHLIRGMTKNGRKRPFDPACDLEPLQSKVSSLKSNGHKIVLLIIDPIVQAVKTGSNQTAKVRRELQPLVDFANSLDCAVLGISHFNKNSGGKNPLERLTGSLNFGAMPRIVLAAAKIGNEKDETRLLVRVKSNIGNDSGGIHYAIEEVKVPGFEGLRNTRVVWGDTVKGSARDLLCAAEKAAGKEDKTALGNAQQFLISLLKDGPLPVNEIKQDAEDAGHAWITIRRAKEVLGISIFKEGMKGGWNWKLPPKVPIFPDDAHSKT